MAEAAYQLSEHARRRIERRHIRPEWLELALQSPDRVEPDTRDAALRHALKAIAEMERRVLRVVYNDSVKPPRVVTAHFDRRLRGTL